MLCDCSEKGYYSFNSIAVKATSLYERERGDEEGSRRHIIGFLLFSEEINKFGFGTKKDIFDNLPTQRKSLLLKIKHYHGLDCTMS